MAKDKKSFVLYLDNRELFDDISDEDAGKLIKHIFSYVSDENPKPANITVKLLFIGIKSQLKRDLKKYEKVCKRNKDNGLKGGRPKNPTEPKKPSGLIDNPTKPKKADSDNDSGNDNESDIYKVIEFELLWNEFHDITKKLKEDKKDTEKHWVKLTVEEKQKAFTNIKSYYDSIDNKKICKKARTY